MEIQLLSDGGYKGMENFDYDKVIYAFPVTGVAGLVGVSGADLVRYGADRSEFEPHTYYVFDIVEESVVLEGDE